MFVCICCNIRDKEIQKAINNGAHSRTAVALATQGAGSKCGRCLSHIDAMLQKNSEFSHNNCSPLQGLCSCKASPQI